MGVDAGVGVAFSCAAGVGVAAADSDAPLRAAGVGDSVVTPGAVVEAAHAPSAHASASRPSVFRSLLIFIRRILLSLKRSR
jgi:hypothetical protein